MSVFKLIHLGKAAIELLRTDWIGGIDLGGSQ